jgi:phosphate transport system substrate-binding protein
MRNARQHLVWLLVMVLMVAGCNGAAPAAQPAANEESGELTFAGSTTVQPLAEEIGKAYREKYPDVSLNIAAGGSGVGIQAIQEGDVDIGMASRKLKEDEITDGMEVHQIAVDVLAVIVHPTNPVDGITREELKSIFMGEITNWSEVGGPDEDIRVVIREETSGTRGAFDEIVLDEEPNSPDADVQITAGEVEQKVANTENAIGYIGFGHVNPEEIKVLEIDGVMPSPESAMDDTYQLQRPLQLLTGPLSRDLAQTYIEFALSEEGQEIVEADGWVPVQ